MLPTALLLTLTFLANPSPAASPTAGSAPLSQKTAGASGVVTQTGELPAPAEPAVPTEVTVPVALGEPGLVITWGGLDRAIVDSRDAGLLAALRLADDRIVQFAGTQNWDGPPPAAMRLLFDLLDKPMHLALWAKQTVGGNEVPFSVRLEVEGSLEELQSIAANFLPALEIPPDQVVLVDPARPGFKSLDSPAGLLSFGVNANADSERSARFVVSLGATSDVPALAPLSNDHAFLSMHGDAKSLQPLLRMAIDEAGPDADEITGMFEMMGLLGENPMRMEMEVAHGSERASFISRAYNLQSMLSGMGVDMETQVPLGAEHVSKVPVGASYAQVSRFDANGTLNAMKQMMPEDVEDDENPFMIVRQMTGLDLETDLVEPLGNTMGFYLAPESGGGILSATMFFSIDDEETLTNSLNKLASMASDELQQQAEGRARIEPWTMTDPSMHGWRIVFPQLPVPVEPSMLISDGWLYVSLYPSATIAAAQQGRSGSSSLLDSEAFRDAFAQLQQEEYVSL